MLIFSLFFINFADLINITFNSACQCSDINNEVDCKRDIFCDWSKNSCGNMKCEDLGSILCQASKNCYFNVANQTCHEFPQQCNFNTCDECCDHLNYTTDITCYDQNIWCSPNPYTDACQIYQDSHCEFQMTERSCLSTFGFCQWNSTNSTCQTAVCASLDLNQCSYYPYYCVFIAGACRPALCEYLPQYFCNYIITGNINGGYQISPCQFNEIDQICENIQPEKLSEEFCYTNTLHTYFWNTKQKQCEMCVSDLLFFSFLFIYILI